ncbi:MAG: NifU family protein [Nitrospirota bacterium]
MTEPATESRPIVRLTDQAIAKVESALAGSRNIGVRLTVGREKGSFTYTFDFVAPDQIDPRDPTIACGARTLYLNHASVEWIRGAEIDYLSSGFTQGWVIDNPNPAWDSDLARRISAVFDQTINPGLAQHGGRVRLVDLQDTVAYVEMSGGCQGCSMATKTLRDGIMRVLSHEFPELTGVVDTTDHASGSTPYYAGDQQGTSPAL